MGTPIWLGPTINIPGIPLRCWDMFLNFWEYVGIFLARGI
jgi:hypothetical protein